MKRWSLAVAALVVIVGAMMLQSCDSNCGDEECLFTESEWQVVQSLSPLPDIPIDTTNKYQNNDAAALLGQKLFFEKSYTGPLKLGVDASQGGLGAVGDKGKINCAACHNPEKRFIDTRSRPGNTSLGITYTGRNAPTLVNIAYYQWFSWTGKQDSLWFQAAGLFEAPPVLAGDRCDFSRMLYAKYRDEYNAIFDEDLDPALGDTSTTTALRFPLKCKPKANAMAPDGAWEMMAPEDRGVILRIMANQGKAMAAYETKLVSRNAPFDKYAAGDLEAITPDAKRGLRLFVGKAACVDCHSGPFFTDQSFHNIGVRQDGPNVPPLDIGRFDDIPAMLSSPFNTLGKFTDDPSVNRLEGLERKDSDTGLFRTPSLRGVSDGGPYFHDGVAHTLAEVVNAYNHGGADGGYAGNKDVRIQPLALAEDEVSDLVAFLFTLSGEPIPEHLTKDPAAAQ